MILRSDNYDVILRRNIRTSYYDVILRRDDTENDDNGSSRFKCPLCISTFAFKQGLNCHWKGVHGNSLDTLTAATCSQKGRISKQEKAPRFTCPFDACDHGAITNILQLSTHCISDHNMDLG